MTKKPLPIEWLGTKGECRFQELCADAMLVANKSTQDVMGWDYLVELAPSSAPALLDQRKAAPTCRVQVKTVWERDGVRAALSLSSAERLSKPSEPAFVCILVVNTNLEFVKACLVHVRGQNLARILKRLRQAAAGLKPKPLNAQTVTFALTDGACFTPSGANLKDALLRACGSDPVKYRLEKEKELEDLGYELGRYQLKAQLNVGNVDEVVELVLGLRPVTIGSAVTTDIRFDTPVVVQHVQLPPPGGSTQIVMRPAPLSECIIRASGAAFGTNLRFAGEVYGPPANMKLADQNLRIIYRSATFELDVRDRSVAFRTTTSADQPQLTPDVWAMHFRLLKLVTAERTNFHIVAPDGNVVEHFKLGPSGQGDAGVQASEMVTVCDAVAWLLEAAGESLRPVTLDQLAQAQTDVALAVDRLVNGKGPVPALNLPAQEGAPQTTEMRLLLVGTWSLADAKYGYAALLDLRGVLSDDHFQFAETASRPIAVKRITEGSSWDAFVQELVSTHGAHGIAALEAADEGEDEGTNDDAASPAQP